MSFFSTTLHGSEKRYEIHPEITVPEYKTDVARVIDAYERLMDNYIRMTESNLTDIRTDMNDVAKKMDALDRKISMLSAQLETIQKKLGIEPPQQLSEKPVDVQNSGDAGQTESENPK